MERILGVKWKQLTLRAMSILGTHHWTVSATCRGEHDKEKYLMSYSLILCVVNSLINEQHLMLRVYSRMWNYSVLWMWEARMNCQVASLYSSVVYRDVDLIIITLPSPGRMLNIARSLSVLLSAHISQESLLVLSLLMLSTTDCLFPI